MPYPALPSARRMHYEIDGTVVGWNTSGYGTGLTNLLNATQLAQINGESPSVSAFVVTNVRSLFVFVLFPEAVDLAYFLARQHAQGGGGGGRWGDLETSTDTTNGADGTWSVPTVSGNPLASAGGFNNDWWRSTSPAQLTSNNTGIVGLRWNWTNVSDNDDWWNMYLWGHKHTGATPDDIIFLESDGTTEWPNDDDWGDVGAGGSAVTHTYYLKNTSATKTANTITVKSSGSDNAKWTVSLDNVSFASSQSISSLAPGGTQIVYVKFTPPALAAGAARPYAAYLEADVTSWT